jgi:chaperonin GroEL (HSP60 family)
VTGGEIVSTFDNPERVKLGHCKLIEEIMIGEDKMIKFSGVERGEACTIVLRGATQHIIDEAERSLHDALAVLSQIVKVRLKYFQFSQLKMHSFNLCATSRNEFFVCCVVHQLI